MVGRAPLRRQDVVRVEADRRHDDQRLAAAHALDRGQGQVDWAGHGRAVADQEDLPAQRADELDGLRPIRARVLELRKGGDDAAVGDLHAPVHEVGGAPALGLWRGVVL
jgi:hypothetical protein